MHCIASIHSAVTLGLLLNVVVLFLAVVHQFDGVGVLASGGGLLALLVGHKGFVLIDVIEFTVGEAEMVALVTAAPDWGHDVEGGEVDELGHVEHVHELGAVADVEPHPVTVRTHVLRLLPQELKEVRAAARPPMRVRLVLVQETRRVLLSVLVVRIVRRFINYNTFVVLISD